MLNESRRGLYLFAFFFMLAGAANMLSRTGSSEWAALMTCINCLIYIGLLLFWLQSVLTRHLHSKAKTYIVTAAFMMLFFILLRIFKYHFAESVAVSRYTAYIYWLPQLLISTLFLMTCICIRRDDEEQGGERGVAFDTCPGDVSSGDDKRHAQACLCF